MLLNSLNRDLFKLRGPQMGGQNRRGRIWRFRGAPIFSPEVPKYLFLKGLGTSGWKIKAPQKRQIQPQRIWPPICGPLINHFQKSPRVRKIRVRNSGAGNGCANFMDAWKKCVLSAGKTMSIKFRVLGGVWGGGGSGRFYFYGREDFYDISSSHRRLLG